MWNENSQVYQLDFGGRVTQESAKNFQIEFRGKQVRITFTMTGEVMKTQLIIFPFLSGYAIWTDRWQRLHFGLSVSILGPASLQRCFSQRYAKTKINCSSG